MQSSNHLHIQDIKLHVGEELAVIVDVPLPQPHPQLLGSVLLDAVSCCQQVTPINQAASTHVHIVILLLLQQRHLPGILSKLCVSLCKPLSRVVDATSDTMSIPPPTLTILTELSLTRDTVESLVELLWLLSDVSDTIDVVVVDTLSKDIIKTCGWLTAAHIS